MEESNPQADDLHAQDLAFKESGKNHPHAVARALGYFAGNFIDDRSLILDPAIAGAMYFIHKNEENKIQAKEYETQKPASAWTRIKQYTVTGLNVTYGALGAAKVMTRGMPHLHEWVTVAHGLTHCAAAGHAALTSLIWCKDGNKNGNNSNDNRDGDNPVRHWLGRKPRAAF